MLILFGWNHQTTKDYGPTMPVKCPNCNNEVALHLVHSRLWFTLFFIPLIPYQSNYYLLCGVCAQGLELQGEQIDKAKKVNRATLSFVNGEISEGQYLSTISNIRMLE